MLYNSEAIDNNTVDIQSNCKDLSFKSGNSGAIKAPGLREAL